MEYDKLSRMTLQDGEYETTTWTYNTTPGKLGQLTSVTMNNGTAQSYLYDALGRMTSQTETVSGQAFTKSYSYDSYGRVQTENWNTGFGIQHTYNQYGYVSSIKTTNNQLIWQPNSYNGRGQVTNYLLGDDYRTIRDWDDYGFPEQMLTQTTGSPPVVKQNEEYNFDVLKGNLLSRTDYLPYNKSETFEYDDLNRLTHVNSVNYTQFHTTFAPNGNITQKTDIGTYTYGNAGPHAVTGLTNTTGNLLPATDQTVDYTAFNKASHINQGSYDYYLTYGPDKQRNRTVLMDGISEATLLTKYYAFGDYEKEITEDGTRHLHYIAGGDGLVAIYVKYDNSPDSLYFILKDHLGSIVGTINSSTGTVLKQNLDAWGRKRNPITWSYTDIPDFPFDRGYTGHEHLKWFGLINMNGRMYDAAICRFLSPDPYVQMPDYTQNFNRYSYALNNPLVYVDPDGNNPLLIAAIIIGAAAGGYTGYKIADAKGYVMGDWQTYGYMLGGTAIGGLAGYAGASIAIAGGFMANAAGIMASSIVYSMGMTPLSGGTIPPNIAFGSASFNMGTGEFGYLGDPDNKWYENVGYGFGALANLQDVVTAFWPGDYQYQYEINKSNGKVGHGNIRKINPDGSTDVKISVANTNTITTKHGGIRGAMEYAWKSNFKKYSGGPEYWLDVPETGWYRIPLSLNSKIVDWMANNLDNNMGLWGVSRTRFGLNFGCVSYSARALWTAGVPTIPIINYLGPKVLWFQLAIRQAGIYSSPYLYNGF